MLKAILLLIIIIIIVILYFFGIHFYHLDLISTFLSEATGAAFGGFLGGCFVWLVREIYVHWRKRPKHVVTYYVADNPENIYGKLKHDRGVAILGKALVKKRLGNKIKNEVLNNGIWEYELTNDHLHRSKMAFYGPFRYDLTEPGSYEASFFYFGRNFDPRRADNPMLFHFEVLLNENHNYYTNEYDNNGVVIPDKRVNTSHRKNVTKGKNFLHYKDFLNDGAETNQGKISKIRFYYNGTGEFEFKAYVPDSPAETFENVVNILTESNIYFYKVEINRIFSIEIPEAI